MSLSSEFDILVAGAGPAGLSLTAALAARGLRVANLSPSQPQEWPNTYGVWLDELEAVGLEKHARCSWPTPGVYTGTTGERRPLDRPYALLDNAAVRDQLRARAEGGDVTWLEGFARHVEAAEGGGAAVHTRDGTCVQARLVVDATGHRPALAERPVLEGSEPGYQQAFGVVLRCDGDPLEGDGMRLMDFRPLEGFEQADAAGPPSFLYAMDLGDGRYFLEETFLTLRPPVGFEELEHRLQARMRRLGLDPELLSDGDRVEEVERVMIPMGVPLPTAFEATNGADRPPVVAFGGAAGMVHPATGYMVGATLQVAPTVADTAARVLASPGVTPREAARQLQKAVWPDDLRRTRQLLTFGMETLLSLDGPSTRRFFDAFFDLSAPEWRDYLSGRLQPGRCAKIMWKMFHQAPLGLKTDMSRVAVSSNAVKLAKTLFNR